MEVSDPHLTDHSSKGTTRLPHNSRGTTHRTPQGTGTTYQYLWTHQHGPEPPTEDVGPMQTPHQQRQTHKKRKGLVTTVEKKATSPESAESARTQTMLTQTKTPTTTSGINTTGNRMQNYAPYELNNPCLHQITSWTTHSRCSTSSQTTRRTRSYRSTKEGGRIFQMPN